MKTHIITAALIYLLGGWVAAQPYTPVVYLNEKVRLAELARSQRDRRRVFVGDAALSS